MTSYSELLKSNRIKAGKFSRKQVLDCLQLASRDIATARKVLGDDSDWCFTIAYNAMLQAARAVMLSKGYRASGEGQHATVIQFAKIALGKEYSDVLEFMERMRRKRHRAVYDMAGRVSKKEAAEAVETAEAFFHNISSLLR